VENRPARAGNPQKSSFSTFLSGRLLNVPRETPRGTSLKSDERSANSTPAAAARSPESAHPPLDQSPSLSSETQLPRAATTRPQGSSQSGPAPAQFLRVGAYRTPARPERTRSA